MTAVAPRWRRLLLAAIVAAAIALQLRVVREWLPVATEIDEPFFVLPAVRMADRRDPNPRWFGHPASTLIYPVAAIYALGWGPRVAEAYEANGSNFFLAARLYSIACFALGLVCVYALARRLFGDVAGLIAPAVVGTTYAMSTLARVARSDGVAFLFGTLALLCLLRAFDEPTRRRLFVAGISVGAAVATKYYLAVFGAAFAFIAVREGRRRIMAREAIGPLVGSLAGTGALVVATFAAATPYFFLDWAATVRSLAAETAPHRVAVAATPLHALGWYLTRGPMGVLAWPVLIAVVLGIAVAVARRRRTALLLLALAALFVVSISFLRLRWERWLLPVVPIYAAFAAHAIERTGSALSRRLGRPRLAPAVAALLTVAALTLPARTLIAQQVPTTSTLMREFVRTLPTGAQVVVENDGGEWLPPTPNDDPKDTVTLPRGPTVRRAYERIPESDFTLDTYRCAGVDHLVVNWGVVRRMRAGKIPPSASALAFYERLEKEGQLLHAVYRLGAPWPYRIYSIAGIACATNRPG